MTKVDLASLASTSVLVFGDFMVDEYVVGSVERISPEAPVPVLRVNEKSRKNGGAGNVVANLVALGAKARILGFVGNDEAGRWLVSEMREMGVDCNCLVLSDDVVTTVKTRFASRGQQFLRCDEEHPLRDDVVANALSKIDVSEMLQGVDVVLVSDYAKGAVEDALCKLIISAARERSIPVIVDPKGVDYSKYKNASACTPNLKELADCWGKPIKDENDELAAAKSLLASQGFECLFLTRSEKGISFFSQEGVRRDFPAHKKEVVDVSGAGDTVACVIALGLASGMEPGNICELANTAASIVCSKFGTSVVTQAELSADVHGSLGAKLVTLVEAREVVESLRKSGKRVVFTNGCFDLLHYGHITSFEQARMQGDALVVAVNSDASIRRLKGENRPIITEHDRLGLIAALSCVDYVLLMEDDNPEEIISTLKPDVIVKGKDWEKAGVPEARIVEAYGGTVKYINMAAGLSTTNIIDRVVSRYGDAE